MTLCMIDAWLGMGLVVVGVAICVSGSSGGEK